MMVERSSSRVGGRTLGVQPDAGTLLLSGTQPEPWLASIPLRRFTQGDPIPADCFRVEGDAWANATTVFLHIEDARGDVELAVPKAPTWVDPKFRQGSDQLVGTATCVNALGQATLRY